MRVPNKIVVVIKVGGREAQEMFVMLRFATARKSPYNILFGPSNEKGIVDVTREQVLKEAKESMDLFVMDYGHLETEWTGQLRVTPLNIEAIERALSAHKQFRRGSSYPPDYQETLMAAKAILAQTPASEMAATVRCEPVQPIAIETPSVLTDGPAVY